MSKNIPGYVSLTVHELGIIEYVAGEEAPRRNFKNQNNGRGGSRRGGKQRRGGGGGNNPGFMGGRDRNNHVNYDDVQPGQQMSHNQSNNGSGEGSGQAFRLQQGKLRNQGPKQADSNPQPEVSNTASEV